VLQLSGYRALGRQLSQALERVRPICSPRWARGFRPSVIAADEPFDQDADRHLHPDERLYTFWHYWRNSFERDAGIRIDHALPSPALAGKLTAAGVDRTPRGWEKTSDHAPIWVEVEV